VSEAAFDSFVDYLLDPANGTEIARFPDMGIKETDKAIQAAKQAFPSWSKTTAKVSNQFISLEK